MSDPFAALDRLAGEGDCEGVVRAAFSALENASEADAVDLWGYIAWARFERGRMEECLDAARAACDPLYEAMALFHLWRMEEAAQALARFEGEGEDRAEGEWYRGLIAEFTGGEAGAHYRRAAELAPHLFGEPVRLSDAEVDSVLEESLAALPPDVARAVADAAIEVMELPEPDPDLDPLLLGLYQGVDRMRRSVEDSGVLPSRILVYRRNVERIARNRAQVVEELRDTLLHEIGHHLGYDEEDLERLDLA